MKKLILATLILSGCISAKPEYVITNWRYDPYTWEFESGGTARVKILTVEDRSKHGHITTFEVPVSIYEPVYMGAEIYPYE